MDLYFVLLGLAITGWMYGVAVLIVTYRKLSRIYAEMDKYEKATQRIIRKANLAIEEAKKVMREHRVDKLAGEVLTGGDYYGD